jgi:hypothetical protein
MALKFSKSKRLAIEAQAWELTQQGWSQVRIARSLEVDQGTVSRALSRVCRRVSRALDETAENRVIESLLQYDHARDEAIQAWERSKKPKRKSARRTSGGASSPSASDGQTTVELIEREGEPAYLAAFLASIDRIRQLLHLDDRTRPKTSDHAGQLPTVRDVLAEALAADAAYVLALPAPTSTEVKP